MSKKALYGRLTFSRLRGKISDINGILKESELELSLRNGYPRFIIKISDDETLSYHKRYKTLQMSFTMLHLIIKGLKGYIENDTSVIMNIYYPKFVDSVKDGKEHIGSVTYSKSDNFYAFHFTFDNYTAIFPIKPDTEYFQIFKGDNNITDTKEINREFLNFYLTNLEESVRLYSTLYDFKNANEVDIK